MPTCSFCQLWVTRRRPGDFNDGLELAAPGLLVLSGVHRCSALKLTQLLPSLKLGYRTVGLPYPIGVQTNVRDRRVTQSPFPRSRPGGSPTSAHHPSCAVAFPAQSSKDIIKSNAPSLVIWAVGGARDNHRRRFGICRFSRLTAARYH